MFVTKITPRIGETDALGHINNCVLPVWFEQARTPLFRVFDPALAVTRESWRLIMVHSEYDYLAQIYVRSEVEVRTRIAAIGNKSFTVAHEAWQEGRVCARGSVVLVHYDFTANRSEPLPADKRALLERHLAE